ncbi:uncharacterized protein [Dendrobates tinctorius]|uniref:uncharacterized protein n=1 Tax=Dendrobates tinctorius TaxID=92724 RepID=UPI003CC9A17D
MEAAKEVEDEQSEESETEETFDGHTEVRRFKTWARFIYYMNAQQASLDFVKDIDKANSFFNKLQDMKLANQTIFNYLKHVRRFLTYNLKSTNLFVDNATLFNSCKFFIEVTEDIRKRLSRGISREVVGKRYQALMSLTKTPRECQRVLDAAKPSFLKCIQNVKHSKVSTKATKLEILYYLEAILVLKHLQRPGVVQNMSVSKFSFYLFINFILLSLKHNYMEEEPYFTMKIPVQMEELRGLEMSQSIGFCLREIDNIQHPNKSIVFCDDVGSPTSCPMGYCRAPADPVARAMGHRDRGIPSHRRRPGPEYPSAPVGASLPKGIFSLYADLRQHPVKFLAFTCLNIVAYHILLEALHLALPLTNNHLRKYCIFLFFSSIKYICVIYRAAIEKEENFNQEKENKPGPPTIETKDGDFQRFISLYPLTAETEPSTLKQCQDKFPLNGPHLYDRWRRRQNRMRVDYIFGLLKDDHPDEEEVKRCIAQKLWKSNLPRVKDIFEKWKKCLT